MTIHHPSYSIFVQMYKDSDTFKPIYISYFYKGKSYTANWEPDAKYVRAQDVYYNASDIHKFLKR